MKKETKEKLLIALEGIGFILTSIAIIILVKLITLF